MNTTAKAILVVAAALCLVGELAHAQMASDGEKPRSRHEPGDEGNARDRGERRRQFQARGPEQIVRTMTRQLELDATQSIQVENIMLAVRPEFDALREKGMANRELRKQLDSNDPDYDTKLQELSAANSEMAASYALLRDRIRTDVNSVLTEEQREQSAVLHEKSRQRRQRNQRPDESKPPRQ